MNFTAELPSVVAERALRLLRLWRAIAPRHPATRQAFCSFLDRVAQADPDGLDALAREGARQLRDLDLQAAFRRDVMIWAAHMEGLTDGGRIALRSDAFVLPMAGDRAAMAALVRHPSAFLRLAEGLSDSGCFAPSNVALLEVALPVETANRPGVAYQLAQQLGLAMLTQPSFPGMASRPDEQALRERLARFPLLEQGVGSGVVVGVRTWFGPMEEVPDDGDLLLAPDEARASTRLGTENAWHGAVAEALALAELPPGAVAVFPPATFLRGLAQARALEQVVSLHAAAQTAGQAAVRFATQTTADGMVACFAIDEGGRILAQGPSVSMSEIHPEGLAYLATLNQEFEAAGPRTQQRLRRRGLN